MQDFEQHTVVDITHIREQRGGGPQKTDGIRAKIHSLTKRLLEKEENEIADQILGDSLLIDGINYEDDLLNAQRAMDLYKQLRSALEYYKQHPQNLAVYKRIHRETGFFSLLALYVELTANAANKPGFQYLTPEQIQFLKQVCAKIPTLKLITQHMEYLRQITLGKIEESQKRLITTLRTRVIGKTGPVSAEQNIPEQFINTLLDILYAMQEEERKPYPQHANIITAAIEKLSAVAIQYSIKQELIQKTVKEACGDFELANPSYVAMLLTRGIENEVSSIKP